MSTPSCITRALYFTSTILHPYRLYTKRYTSMGKRERSLSVSSSSDSSSSSSSSREKRKRRKKKEKKRRKAEKAQLSELDKAAAKLQVLAGQRVPGRGAMCLTIADFFEKQPEFALWLREKRKGAVEEQGTSDEARVQFCKFAQNYNKGLLKDKFYSGEVHSTSLGAASRTTFKWAFASKLDDETVMKIGQARDSTDTNTYEKTWTALKGKGGGKGGGKKGSKGGDSEGCSSCKGPWPCRYSPQPQDSSKVDIAQNGNSPQK